MEKLNLALTEAAHKNDMDDTVLYYVMTDIPRCGWELEYFHYCFLHNAMNVQ